MAYYPDLTPYVYFENQRPAGTLNVGWLDKSEPFETGPVPDGFLDKLKQIPTSMHTRGWHMCSFCPSGRIDTGKGYSKLFGVQSTCEIAIGKYAAPHMIIHYVEVHGYKPPDEFIEAVMNNERIKNDN